MTKFGGGGSSPLLPVILPNYPDTRGDEACAESDFCSPCSGVFVTQGFDPIVTPPFSPLPANLAGAEGLPFSGKDASANGIIRVVHVDAQAAELLLNLQDFKLASACMLECGDQRFQVPDSRQIMSNQPSPRGKPRDIAV